MMKADQTLDGTASAKNDRRRTITMVDKLTRLYSFRGFMRASADLLAIANGRPSCAMLLSIDLRHVKFIEHALGRESGDQLLTRTAEILRRVFRGAAVIGRLGFDKFAVLILASPSKCTELMASLNQSIEAANLAEPTAYLSLAGKYCLFDPRHSDFIAPWLKRKNRSKQNRIYH
jgi:diguanylate cyclase (GGDEF)-like protein